MNQLVFWIPMPQTPRTKGIWVGWQSKLISFRLGQDIFVVHGYCTENHIRSYFLPVDTSHERKKASLKNEHIGLSISQINHKELNYDRDFNPLNLEDLDSGKMFTSSVNMLITWPISMSYWHNDDISFPFFFVFPFSRSPQSPMEHDWLLDLIILPFLEHEDIILNIHWTWSIMIFIIHYCRICMST